MTDEVTTELKDQILADPSLILEDDQLMRALLEADKNRALGRNVVDLRGVLVDRLEERLDRLEDTHREVLAAAYENVAGTNQVHRACLALLEAEDFGDFLQVLTHDVANILGVEIIRVALEAPAAKPRQSLGPKGPLHDVVLALPEAGVDAYIRQGRGLGPRRVTLRQVDGAPEDVFGPEALRVRSEALLQLNLGRGKLPGLLVFGSTDPRRFHPDQGIDLLEFFGGVFERSMRRWLA